MRRAILIAGPTASGKSALALALADRLVPQGGAVIVNADSMQVYRDLRILTARPGPEDEARHPHALYGVLDGAEASSAMRWRDLALPALEQAWAAGRWPIVVGGTGLYFRALLDGLAPIPAIPDAVRAAARMRHAERGGAAFHAELARRDPESAALRPGDSQRLIRAWEVLEATGHPISHWQRQPAEGLQAETLRFVLRPDPAVLAARIDARLLAMVAAGALAEVAALLARGLDPALPVMRAVGLRELAAALPESGADSAAKLAKVGGLAGAIAAAQAATRQLAKRQRTWLRNQMSDWTMISQQDESFSNEIFAKISQSWLTGPR